MFEGCTGLIYGPSSLSATKLSTQCCQYMFYGCKNLTQAPILPATSLAEYCYDNMFYGCEKLT
jgi:hypothetical protein